MQETDQIGKPSQDAEPKYSPAGPSPKKPKFSEPEKLVKKHSTLTTVRPTRGQYASLLESLNEAYAVAKEPPQKDEDEDHFKALFGSNERLSPWFKSCVRVVALPLILALLFLGPSLVSSIRVWEYNWTLEPQEPIHLLLTNVKLDIHVRSYYDVTGTSPIDVVFVGDGSFQAEQRGNTLEAVCANGLHINCVMTITVAHALILPDIHIVAHGKTHVAKVGSVSLLDMGNNSLYLQSGPDGMINEDLSKTDYLHLHFRTMRVGSIIGKVGEGSIHFAGLRIEGPLPTNGTHIDLNMARGSVVIETRQSMEIEFVQPQALYCLNGENLTVTIDESCLLPEPGNGTNSTNETTMTPTPTPTPTPDFGLGDDTYVNNTNSSDMMGGAECSGKALICPLGVEVCDKGEWLSFIRVVSGGIYVSVLNADDALTASPGVQQVTTLANDTENTKTTVPGDGFRSGLGFDATDTTALSSIHTWAAEEPGTDVYVMIHLIGPGQDFGTFIFTSRLVYLQIDVYWFSVFSLGTLTPRTSRMEIRLDPGMCPFGRFSSNLQILAVAQAIEKTIDVHPAEGFGLRTMGGKTWNFETALDGVYYAQELGLMSNPALVVAIIVSLVIALFGGIGGSVALYFAVRKGSQLYAGYLQSALKLINLKTKLRTEKLDIPVPKEAKKKVKQYKIPSPFEIPDQLLKLQQIWSTDSLAAFLMEKTKLIPKKMRVHNAADAEHSHEGKCIDMPAFRAKYEEYCSEHFFTERPLKNAKAAKMFRKAGVFLLQQSSNSTEAFCGIRHKRTQELKENDPKQLKRISNSIDRFMATFYVVTGLSQDFVLCVEYLEHYEQYCLTEGLALKSVKKRELKALGITQVRKTVTYLFNLKWCDPKPDGTANMTIKAKIVNFLRGVGFELIQVISHVLILILFPAPAVGLAIWMQGQMHVTSPIPQDILYPIDLLERSIWEWLEMRMLVIISVIFVTLAVYLFAGLVELYVYYISSLLKNLVQLAEGKGNKVIPQPKDANTLRPTQSEWELQEKIKEDYIEEEPEESDSDSDSEDEDSAANTKGKTAKKPAKHVMPGKKLTPRKVVQAIYMVLVGMWLAIVVGYICLVAVWMILGAILNPDRFLPMATGSAATIGVAIGTVAALNAARKEGIRVVVEKLQERSMAMLKNSPLSKMAGSGAMGAALNGDASGLLSGVAEKAGMGDAIGSLGLDPASAMALARGDLSGIGRMCDKMGMDPLVCSLITSSISAGTGGSKMEGLTQISQDIFKRVGKNPLIGECLLALGMAAKTPSKLEMSIKKVVVLLPSIKDDLPEMDPQKVWSMVQLVQSLASGGQLKMSSMKAIFFSSDADEPASSAPADPPLKSPRGSSASPKEGEAKSQEAAPGPVPTAETEVENLADLPRLTIPGQSVPIPSAQTEAESDSGVGYKSDSGTQGTKKLRPRRKSKTSSPLPLAIPGLDPKLLEVMPTLLDLLDAFKQQDKKRIGKFIPELLSKASAINPELAELYGEREDIIRGCVLLASGDCSGVSVLLSSPLLNMPGIADLIPIMEATMAAQARDEEKLANTIPNLGGLMKVKGSMLVAMQALTAGYTLPAAEIRLRGLDLALLQSLYGMKRGPRKSIFRSSLHLFAKLGITDKTKQTRMAGYFAFCRGFFTFGLKEMKLVTGIPLYMLLIIIHHAVLEKQEIQFPVEDVKALTLAQQKHYRKLCKAIAFTAGCEGAPGTIGVALLDWILGNPHQLLECIRSQQGHRDAASIPAMLKEATSSNYLAFSAETASVVAEFLRPAPGTDRTLGIKTSLSCGERIVMVATYLQEIGKQSQDGVRKFRLETMKHCMENKKDADFCVKMSTIAVKSSKLTQTCSETLHEREALILQQWDPIAATEAPIWPPELDIPEAEHLVSGLTSQMSSLATRLASNHDTLEALLCIACGSYSNVGSLMKFVYPNKAKAAEMKEYILEIVHMVEIQRTIYVAEATRYVKNMGTPEQFAFCLAPSLSTEPAEEIFHACTKVIVERSQNDTLIRVFPTLVALSSGIVQYMSQALLTLVPKDADILLPILYICQGKSDLALSTAGALGKALGISANLTGALLAGATLGLNAPDALHAHMFPENQIPSPFIRASIFASKIKGLAGQAVKSKAEMAQLVDLKRQLRGSLSRIAVDSLGMADGISRALLSISTGTALDGIEEVCALLQVDPDLVEGLISVASGDPEMITEAMTNNQKFIDCIEAGSGAFDNEILLELLKISWRHHGFLDTPKLAARLKQDRSDLSFQAGLLSCLSPDSIQVHNHVVGYLRTIGWQPNNATKDAATFLVDCAQGRLDCVNNVNPYLRRMGVSNTETLRALMGLFYSKKKEILRKWCKHLCRNIRPSAHNEGMSSVEILDSVVSLAFVVKGHAGQWAWDTLLHKMGEVADTQAKVKAMIQTIQDYYSSMYDKDEEKDTEEVGDEEGDGEGEGEGEDPAEEHQDESDSDADPTMALQGLSSCLGLSVDLVSLLCCLPVHILSVLMDVNPKDVFWRLPSKPIQLGVMFAFLGRDEEFLEAYVNDYRADVEKDFFWSNYGLVCEDKAKAKEIVIDRLKSLLLATTGSEPGFIFKHPLVTAEMEESALANIEAIYSLALDCSNISMAVDTVCVGDDCNPAMVKEFLNLSHGLVDAIVEIPELISIDSATVKGLCCCNTTGAGRAAGIKALSIAVGTSADKGLLLSQAATGDMAAISRLAVQFGKMAPSQMMALTTLVSLPSCTWSEVEHFLIRPLYKAHKADGVTVEALSWLLQMASCEWNRFFSQPFSESVINMEYCEVFVRIMNLDFLRLSSLKSSVQTLFGVPMDIVDDIVRVISVLRSPNVTPLVSLIDSIGVGQESTFAGTLDLLRRRQYQILKEEKHTMGIAHSLKMSDEKLATFSARILCGIFCRETSEFLAVPPRPEMSMSVSDLSTSMGRNRAAWVDLGNGGVLLDFLKEQKYGKDSVEIVSLLGSDKMDEFLFKFAAIMKKKGCSAFSGMPVDQVLAVLESLTPKDEAEEEGQDHQDSQWDAIQGMLTVVGVDDELGNVLGSLYNKDMTKFTSEGLPFLAKSANIPPNVVETMSGFVASDKKKGLQGISKLMGVQPDMVLGMYGVVQGDIAAVEGLAKSVGGFNPAMMSKLKMVLTKLQGPAKLREKMEATKKESAEGLGVEKDLSLPNVFKMFDKNKNGAMEFSEFQDVLKYMGMTVTDEKARRIYSDATPSGTDPLTFAEFEKAMGKINQGMARTVIESIGLSVNKIVAALVGIVVVLLLVLGFIFSGIAAMTTGSAFGSVVNSTILASASGSINKVSSGPEKIKEGLADVGTKIEEAADMLSGG